MNLSDAYTGIFNALSQARATLGQPSTITLLAGSEIVYVITHAWSKSAINNNTQVVFMVGAHALADCEADIITAIRYGEEIFPIQMEGKRPPTDKKPYWFFPVKQ